MDNIKLCILELKQNIKDLQKERKKEYQQLKNEKERLNILQKEENNLNTNLIHLNEISELAKNRKIFILKDELVFLLMIVLDVLIACTIFSTPLINFGLIAIMDWIIAEFHLYNISKNKKLIDYYKKANNINPNKNVNINRRKIKKLLPQIMTSKHNTIITLKNISLEIKAIRKYIHTKENRIETLNTEIRNNIVKVNELINQRNEIIDKTLEKDPKMEETINRHYTKKLTPKQVNI